MSAARVPVIELKAVEKSFGAVEVLSGVNFVAMAGEVTALVGDNGAGKSTLIKGIAGVQSYDSGTILFEGKEVSIKSPVDASSLGIEVVYQDLALCDNLDIVQNMFLGREMVRSISLDDETMEQKAASTLKGLSVRTISSVRQKVSSLSGGQRQTVAIARSVLWENKLVILDEPTAALGVSQTKQVLKMVRDLADTGVAVILISHNMQEVLAVADSVQILRLGQMVANLKASETNLHSIVSYITGAESLSINGEAAL
ncbi:MAG: sugar ABC transporter ATP-binding protein [Streptomycetaceae bacterium]|nr:MAG: sugar ABC transporter ATP-binding protein [Streptomycetaceae bacterium]